MNITIQDQTGSTASVSTRGAELKSFRTGGQEHIWQSDPKFWTGSAPFLFPIASNLRNNTVLIEGKPYSMGAHGFARKLEWEVSEQTEDSVTMTLRENEETLAAYPFRFVLSAAYTLENGELHLNIRVKNADEREMPFCLGTHPAFCVPFDPDGGKFSDYQIVLEKEEVNSCPLYDNEKRQINVENRTAFLEADNRTLKLDYEVFDKVDTVIFDRLNSRSASLIDTRTGRTIVLDFPEFEYLAVWTKKEAPYVCIEPWQGLSVCSDEDDNFLSKRGVQCLKPGESKEFSLHFSVKF